MTDSTTLMDITILQSLISPNSRTIFRHTRCSDQGLHLQQSRLVSQTERIDNLADLGVKMGGYEQQAGEIEEQFLELEQKRGDSVMSRKEELSQAAKVKEKNSLINQVKMRPQVPLRKMATISDLSNISYSLAQGTINDQRRGSSNSESRNPSHSQSSYSFLQLEECTPLQEEEEGLEENKVDPMAKTQRKSKRSSQRNVIMTLSTTQRKKKRDKLDQIAKREDSKPEQKLPKSQKPCSCSKSRCLKLYCDCFASGLYCSDDCQCRNCYNKLQFYQKREQAIKRVQERNSNAFGPKIAATRSTNLQHLKGCTCKKSNCQQNYCECFQNGIMCGQLCKCRGCMNNPEAMAQKIIAKGKKIKLMLPPHPKDMGEPYGELEDETQQFKDQVNVDGVSLRRTGRMRKYSEISQEQNEEGKKKVKRIA